MTLCGESFSKEILGTKPGAFTRNGRDTFPFIIDLACGQSRIFVVLFAQACWFTQGITILHHKRHKKITEVTLIPSSHIHGQNKFHTKLTM